MKFYTFGNSANPVLMLFPGTCCHWKNNFGEVVPLLENDFYVVCVSYDGFDETEQTIFPDMISETEKVEKYILEKFGGGIHAAYGCSLGGSFVGLLVQRKRVHIKHGILGSSDLDQGDGLGVKFQAKIASSTLYGMLQKGKIPDWMMKIARKKYAQEMDYMEKMINMFLPADASYIKKESIYNQFYSDLITPVENDIEVDGTSIHCFYAVKMGKKYEGRYYRHFKSPDIRRHKMQHEELLVCHPKLWVQEVRSCCEI